MDVRAKQRLCYRRCLVSLNLRVGGFAPRHLNCWASSCNLRMRKFIVLAIFFTCCSASAVQENSNSVVMQTPVIAQTDKNSDSTRKLNDSISNTWQMRINDSKVRTAVVMANSKTPNGEAQAIFWLQCLANPNYVVSIDFIVRDTSKITGFNFDDFEGPDAPAQRKKLVEFRAVSPQSNLSFRASVAGGYGGAGEPDAFFFTPDATNRDKDIQLARMIAKGSTKVTVVVHDYRNNQKTIEATFPAIDASSDVAKMLNGCRK